MATTHEVKWGRIQLVGHQPFLRVEAVVYTPSNQARYAELTEEDLIGIIHDARRALANLRGRGES